VGPIGDCPPSAIQGDATCVRVAARCNNEDAGAGEWRIVAPCARPVPKRTEAGGYARCPRLGPEAANRGHSLGFCHRRLQRVIARSTVRVA
jgi:hypothetical protein